MNYEPHKYQKEFHQSGARFRTFVAGRRGGKSLAGTIEALKWVDRVPLIKKRPTHGMIIAPTYGMLMDVNIDLIMRWCPPESIKSWNKVEKNLEFINGSTIAFRSGDNPDRLRGTGKDWIWLDEACFMGKYVWETVYPVLTDTRGVAWITTTPQGYDWVYNTFYEPAVKGNKDYEAWKFTTLENPHIDKALVEQAKKDLSDVMFKQEYMASFEKFEGLIYPDFSEERHVRETKDVVTDIYFIGLDVGWNHPTAGLLMKEDKERNLYVIDEFKKQHLTVPEISNQLRGLIARNGLTLDRIEMMVIDPASRGTQQSSGQSVLAQLQEEGWGFMPGNNDVMAGINRLTRLIKENRFFASKSCPQFISEMNTYHWKKWDESKDGIRNKPFKLDDDLADTARYVAMSRPDYFEHPRLDMYGRLVEPGTDPVTGYTPEEVDNLDHIESMMQGVNLDDIM